MTTGDVHTQYFLLAGETTDAKLYNADLIVYSDAGTTETIRLDANTGNIDIQGLFDHGDTPFRIDTSAITDSKSILGILAATSHTDSLLAATVASLEGYTGSS